MAPAAMTTFRPIRASRDTSRRMDRVHQLKSLLDEHLRVASPGAIVTDSDDRGSGFFGELGQLIGGPEDRQPADARAAERGVGIDESDGGIFSGGAKDIQHNFPVAAGADDEHVHELIIGQREAIASIWRNSLHPIRYAPTRRIPMPVRSIMRACSMENLAQGWASRRGLLMGLPVPSHRP